jgi:histone deacetylase 6
VSARPTGLLRDPRFRAHAAPYPHPERPERLTAIEAKIEVEALAQMCRSLKAREATDGELLAIHTPELLAEVADTATRPFSSLDPDTYAAAPSAEAARLAAGGLVDLTLAVLSGELANGLALVRPPGHHAERERAMGFCLFNNVAVAAAAARAAGAKRVLIVDWDVHHGNGTQHSFWDDPTVLYFSTHQWPFYPGTGALHEVGGAAAAGRTINVPWGPGRGDADHMAAFDRVLVPAARRFEPDLVLVSAGYDAARGDLLGEQLVTPDGYAAMTARLTELAKGRVVLALEGGYNLEVIAESAAACLRVLLGEEPPTEEFGETTTEANRVLRTVIAAQSPHWPSVF